jgi:hypothetical protein
MEVRRPAFPSFAFIPREYKIVPLDCAIVPSVVFFTTITVGAGDFNTIVDLYRSRGLPLYALRQALRSHLYLIICDELQDRRGRANPQSRESFGEHYRLDWVGEIGSIPCDDSIARGF